jgi:hypothetical protein
VDNTDLPDNTVGWRSEWLYIVKLPRLPRRTGHKPVNMNERDLRLSSRDFGDLKEVLEAGAHWRHEETRCDRGCSRQVVFPADDSASQGLGSPRI